MLYQITSFDQIDKRKLMDLYFEGNWENTDYFYPEISDKKQGPFRLCDCVGKKNTASINAHKKCGFNIVSDKGMNYLTNEIDKREYGMQYSYLL